MSYKLIYKFYPGFISQMKKYNENYKHLKNFKELKKEVILALQTSPRKYVPLNAHPLHGNLKGFWSISTGLNSNRDRVIYAIDDESMLEYWKENEII